MLRDKQCLLAAVTLAGLFFFGITAAAAEDKCDPSSCGGGSVSQPAAPGSGGDTDDVSGLSGSLGNTPVWSTITRGVAQGSQWLGDAYGRNVQGTSDPAPEPPRIAPPAPTSSSDDPDYAVNGNIAGPVGDYVAQGSWWLGNWAGSSPPPQLGPGPNAPDPAPPADSSGGYTGIWTQPLVKDAEPRFR